MGRVDGTVVVVTGGSVGIGRATAEMLGREGARVAVTDVQDEEGESAAEAIRAAGGEARYWHMDVTEEDQVQGVLDEVVEAFGRLDAIVNNAGISGADAPTHEVDAEDWQRVMDVNVNGVFYCTKHAIPHLKDAGGGSIVNLSSIYGLVSAPDIPPYHASKGAVRLMTKTDALLYAEDGIRVNSVHPGFIWTPLVEAYLEDQGSVEEGRAELAAAHPLGRVGEPDEIAAGILFLVSDESSFVTGSELVIDGGYTAR